MQVFKKIIIVILTLEARAALSRYSPKIIAVTGSVGKTTTKDAIFASLSPYLHIRKSDKSFNSDIGVPLAILGLENGWHNPFVWILNIIRGFVVAVGGSEYPQWLVLEVGADRPGDIRRIARWLRPDVAVITAVPETPVHVEFFDSPKAVLREKQTLAEHLKPGGKLVINGDDPHLSDLHTDFRGRTITFGIDEHNDFFASHQLIVYENGKPVGTHFRANHAGSSVPVEILGTLGIPRVYAALAAFAVSNTVGVDLVSASKGLSSWSPPPGRMRLIAGVRGSLIIDDTYNSSPAAALAALDTLRAVTTSGRKIAILGDMLELGKYANDAHKEVGTRAAACADMLITVGFRARLMAEAALDAGMSDESVRSYEQGESDRAGLELEKELQHGDIVLVKGSQSIRMERAVLSLMAETGRAAELLVRQESEWSST
ncbi:MAG TPA: UDP-N-acetylmuramoyl-tripeptide--D-alanyl-D-alanine ligase [Candidatus Paceibacterota bacterium]|nr:UDP-N-acetylmuramoyl-tripeptide--D-alanyl-D-alanine ligase [Candidatus Paceibacterota bacterium]